MSIAIKDIALKLRVSPSTVSRALSGKDGVSEEMRQRIISYAEDCMFQVNPAAQALRTGKGSGLILIAPMNRPEVARIRDEILLTKLHQFFGSAFSLTVDNEENLEYYIKMALAENPQAIIVSGIWHQNFNLLEACNTHKTALLSIDSCLAGHDEIIIDRSTGTEQMTRMFLLSGCSHPVYFKHPEELDTEGYGRLSGIQRAYKEAGLELKPEYCVEFNPKKNDSQLGYEIFSELLKRSYVDAVFAFNDLAALGVQRAIHSFNPASNSEIKLVGFDDLPISTYLPTSLSSISIKLETLIEQASSMLQQRILDLNAPRERAIIPSTLLIRESSRITDRRIIGEIFRQTNHN